MSIKTKHECEGVFPAIATPFRTNFDIDREALQEHLHWTMNQGASGGLVFGTTGEANSIALSKRLEFITSLEGQYKKEALFIGIGATALGDCLALAEESLKAGYNQLLCLPPFYYKNIDEERLYDFYASIVRCINDKTLRMYIYHIPQISGVGVPEGVVKRLQAEFPDNIVGIKDSSGDFDGYAKPIMHHVPISILVGDDNHLLANIQMNGPGCITALANVVPHISVSVINHCKKGDIDKAKHAQNTLKQWRQFLKDFSIVSAIKYMIFRRTGHASWNTFLSPHSPLSLQEKNRIDAFVEHNQ